MGNVVVSLGSPAPVQDIWGVQYAIQGTLHLSTSYATGGDTLTFAQLGINNLFYLLLAPAYDNTDSPAVTWVLTYVPPTTGSNILVQAWTAAAAPGTAQGLIEVASTTDLHLAISNFIAFGSD